jgi:hypothetical protein
MRENLAKSTKDTKLQTRALARNAGAEKTALTSLTPVQIGKALLEISLQLRELRCRYVLRSPPRHSSDILTHDHVHRITR